MHVFAHIGLGQGVTVGVGTANVVPVGPVSAVLPLVTDGPHAVGILQVVGGFENCVLRVVRRSVVQIPDADRADGLIVDILNSIGCSAGKTVAVTASVTAGVNIANGHAQVFADLRIAGCECGAIRVSNGLPGSVGSVRLLPLVSHAADSCPVVVRITEVGGGTEGLVFGGAAADGQ